MANNILYPNATFVNNGVSSGPYTSGPFKIVVHTTETSGIPDYDNGRSAPHITFDPASGDIEQHTPFNTSARSLRNASGGVQTNRDSALQLEVVAYSDKSVADQKPYRLYVGDLSHAAYDTIADICVFLITTFNVSNTIILPRPKPIYGANSPSRMSPSTWDSFNGICGHFEVPENTHWDPGAFDFVKLSSLIMNKEDNMPIPEDQMQLLLAAIGNVAKEVQLWGFDDSVTPPKPSNWQYQFRTNQTVNAIRTMLGDLEAVVELDDDSLNDIAIAVANEQYRRQES